MREGCGQFLPREEFEAPSEAGVVDGGEYGVPSFDEIAATGVAEEAEAGVGGEGGEDVADELVTLNDAVGGPGQAGDVEDGFEVAVALDEARAGVLETGLGELGLDEEVVELKIDLGAIGVAVLEGHAGIDAEAGLCFWGYAEKSGDRGSEGIAVRDGGVAEDAHEKSVGAVGGVELHPGPVGSRADAAVGGVDLSEAAGPGWVGADADVGGGVEVAVASLLIAAEDDDGVGTRG